MLQVWQHKSIKNKTCQKDKGTRMGQIVFEMPGESQHDTSITGKSE